MHLVRQDDQTEGVAVQLHGLRNLMSAQEDGLVDLYGPATALLVVERPVHGVEQEEHADLAA